MAFVGIGPTVNDALGVDVADSGEGLEGVEGRVVAVALVGGFGSALGWHRSLRSGGIREHRCRGQEQDGGEEAGAEGLEHGSVS